MVKKRLIDEMEDAIHKEIAGRIKQINGYLRDYRPDKNMEIHAQIYEHEISPLFIRNRTLYLGLNLEMRGKVITQGLEWNIE